MLKLLYEYLNSPHMQRLSPNTGESYGCAIRKFLQITEIQSPEQITLATIERFETAMLCKNKSLNCYLAAIKSFLDWLRKHGYQVMDPDLIEKHKDEQTILRVPTTEEVKEMLQASCLRDRAILMLLCFSGLRVSELCALNRADVDVKHRKAYLWSGKGKKDRLVFFNQATADDITAYLHSRRDKAKPLFLDQYGNRVTVRCIQWTIKKYAPVSDISPHRLRAYFATMCINRDVPINAVKEYMGHENIKTTMRYISMSDEYLRREYDKGIE